MESDSSSAVSWVSSKIEGPWKLYFVLNEIKSLCSSLPGEFIWLGKLTSWLMLQVSFH